MIGSEAQREDAVEYLKLCLDMAKEGRRIHADQLRQRRLSGNLRRAVALAGKKPSVNWASTPQKWV